MVNIDPTRRHSTFAILSCDSPGSTGSTDGEVHDWSSAEQLSNVGCGRLVALHGGQQLKQQRVVLVDCEFPACCYWSLIVVNSLVHQKLHNCDQLFLILIYQLYLILIVACSLILQDHQNVGGGCNDHWLARGIFREHCSYHGICRHPEKTVQQWSN